MTTYEMVHIGVQWATKDTFPSGHVHGLWFKVSDGMVSLVTHFGVGNADDLFGYMTFAPMPTNGEFYDPTFNNNLDVELTLNGVEETFAIGDDVETLGALAYARWQNPIMEGDKYFVAMIALYEVAISVSHTNDGNDSETWYELLGILDNAKLPLALVTKDVELIAPEAFPPTIPSKTYACTCPKFVGNNWLCEHCGGMLF